ncbi:hypothetical protein AB0D33_14145 [Streptomyces sp. NPDC048404]|uniref:hypothetical protein n=1 Tax=unclassified Streptomyces TaxID=2593676 RepID=UPI0034161A30
MFEIRVICAPQDTERVVAALDSTFTTGTVTVYPTRDGHRNRLYIRADHLPTADAPDDTAHSTTPEAAYAAAPNMVSEVGWTARTARAVAAGTFPDREFWLRKAALLDRIALQDQSDGAPTAAADLATQAARTLMDMDEMPVICNPRAYVRQQYAHWTKHQ